MSNYRLASWNVNGIRAVIKKNCLFEWMAEFQPDVLGLQETKISADLLTPEMLEPMGYHTYWSHANKKGYSGVAIFTKEKPISVTEGFGMEAYDTEGRTLIAEYPDFVLYNIYYPNGQRGEDRLNYKLGFYDAFLDHAEMMRRKGKKVVACGDFNTAHKPIDLARPKENEKVSGFLPIEREWMDKFVTHGYTDTFRHFHPDKTGQYSWWNMRSFARERNVGWRIDYFFTGSELKNNLQDATIEPQILGSDHCPVTLTLGF